MLSFTARFNLRFSKTAGCWSINQDKYKYKAEYLFTSAGTWGRPHRRRQPGSQGLVALDERFVAPRLRQPLVQGPRLLRGRSQRRSPERWEMRKSLRWVIKERILYGYRGTKGYLGLASSYQTFDIWIHRKVSMSPLDRPELRSASSSKPKLPENNFASMPFINHYLHWRWLLVAWFTFPSTHCQALLC